MSLWLTEFCLVMMAYSIEIGISINGKRSDYFLADIAL
jgi:hypothetical protein